MNIIKVIKVTLLSFCLITGLTACVQTPTRNTEENCSRLTHKKLQSALTNAQTSLSNRSCHYQFDSIHRQLLTVAQNDPANENGNLFLQFYKWNVGEGVISSRQGKEYYNRYFKPTFGHVLSNDRNVCSMASNKDEVITNLAHELANKKLGLQDIMQNRDAYFEAQRIHNELVFLIETTLMACNNA